MPALASVLVFSSRNYKHLRVKSSLNKMRKKTTTMRRTRKRKRRK